METKRIHLKKFLE